MISYPALARQRTSNYNDECEWLRGVDDYYGGVLPEGWNTDRPRDPYLRGWKQAAKDEVG
jgi:hypothetical protein